MSRNIAQLGKTAIKYLAANTQPKADNRYFTKPKVIKFSNNMKKQAVKWLSEDKWSPKIISADWIYQWIWQCKHRNKSADKGYKKIYNHLKHCKRRRKRGPRKDNRGIIQDRVSIERRPKIINKRGWLGDIEVDFMIGKNHNEELLVMTDRATLYTFLQKGESRGSSIMSNANIKRVK